MQQGIPVTRKYEIFISSSFTDLKKHRWELVRQVLSMKHIPVGMEMFIAGEQRNLDVIEEAIEQCDLFIILVGARLGTEISAEDATAFTRWEYDKAQQLGKPTLAFLLDEDEYRSERDKIVKGDPERKHDEALDQLRTKVQQRKTGNRIVEFFSYDNPAKLRADVATALVPAIARLEGGGWAPGRLYDDLNKRVVFDADVSANPFFQRFAKGLNTFKILSKRTTERADLKSDLAQYFWNLYLPRITGCGITHLFFESGSSVAYVAEEFDRILREEVWAEDLWKTLVVRTNNILIYLDLTLIEPNAHPINLQLEPPWPMEEKYGATFGRLMEAMRLAPPVKPRSLHRDAIPLVEGMTSKMKQEYGESGMILMTASGVELSTDSDFPGPHVGSYYNKLLKRSLLQVGCPTVLFLDEYKFPRQFEIGKCFAVFGPAFEWHEKLKQIPLAIAIATTKENKMQESAGTLKELGFVHHDPMIDEFGSWTMVAGNDLFHKRFHNPDL